MREDIVFEELIEQIDLILNSSKPLPYHMKAERKLAEVLRHLQEIPEYDNLKQFEPLFDVESFLIHFLASADYTDLLKIIDRSTMKFKHIDDYTHLMALVVNPNIPFFEKTVVVDRMLEMGEGSCFANCYNISDSDLKYACLAETKNDEGYCYRISNPDDKNFCLAKLKRQKGICYRISDVNKKNQCIAMVK